MAPSESDPNSPISDPTTLSVDDVVNIIATAKAASADPVSTAMKVFCSLGDNVMVSGDTLRQAVSLSSIPLSGDLSLLVSAIQGVTRAAAVVTWTNNRQVQIILEKAPPIRFEKEVRWVVCELNGLPGLNNITGISVHEGIWLGIHSLQMLQNQGQRSVRVVTSVATRDFPLG